MMDRILAGQKRLDGETLILRMPVEIVTKTAVWRLGSDGEYYNNGIPTARTPSFCTYSAAQYPSGFAFNHFKRPR